MKEVFRDFSVFKLTTCNLSLCLGLYSGLMGHRRSSIKSTVVHPNGKDLVLPLFCGDSPTTEPGRVFVIGVACLSSDF